MCKQPMPQTQATDSGNTQRDPTDRNKEILASQLSILSLSETQRTNTACVQASAHLFQILKFVHCVGYLLAMKYLNNFNSNFPLEIYIHIHAQTHTYTHKVNFSSLSRNRIQGDRKSDDQGRENATLVLGFRNLENELKIVVCLNV